MIAKKQRQFPKLARNTRIDARPNVRLTPFALPVVMNMEYEEMQAARRAAFASVETDLDPDSEVNRG